MNEASMAVGRRVAELLLAEFEHAYRSGDFGVVAQDVAVFDKQHFLALLPDVFEQAKGRLRISLVGELDDVATFQSIYPQFAEFVSSEEEMAVRWRNKKLRTIVVVANGPLSKQASLKEFRSLGEHSLITRLCDEQRDKAEVLKLRSLWDALKSPRGAALSLQALVRFATTLQGFSALERSVRAPKALHAVGLFPDSLLAEEQTEGRLVKRLRWNADTLNMVSNATPEDWDRMATFCRYLPGKEKAKFNVIRKRLKALNQSGTGELDLKDIELADVLVLWKGKVPSSAQGGGASGGGAADGKRVAVESRVAELLLVGDRSEQLADIAERVSIVAGQAENSQSISDDEPLAGGEGTSDPTPVANEPVVSVNANVIALARSRSTAAEWGGVIEIESDRLDALTEVPAFKSWQPFLLEDFKALLMQFVEVDLAPKVCVEHAEKLANARGHLLNHLADLTVSPVAVLAGRSGVLQAATEYLEAYDHLLRQLQLAYQEMYAQANDEAEKLINWLLAMELYVYRRDGVTEVLLSPVHPLNLWRSVAIVRDLQSLGGRLSEAERRTLIAATAEDMQLLRVLLLPQIESLGNQTALLGHAGAIAHLPLFKEAPRGVLEPDGLKTIQTLASLLSHLRPFARPGLQVLLVNAPRPGRFLESVMDALDLDNATAEDTFWGVHFRFRYTSDDTRGWTTEFEDIDDQLKDRIRAGQELGLISLSVIPDIKKWPDVIEEVRQLPAHLTVVFDPFEVKTNLVARASLHDLSPWIVGADSKLSHRAD